MLTDERESINDLFHEPELAAIPMHVKAGCPVEASEDHFVQHMYLIVDGQVRLTQAGPGNQTRLVDILGPDDWFGCASLAMSPQPWVQAVAATDSQLLAVSGKKLLELLPRHPTVIPSLIQQLVLKLKMVCVGAGTLVFDDCNHRLIKTLLRFADSAAATTRDQHVVLRITHQELAQAVGVARETISVALTQLRRKHVLRTGRNQLIFDRAALQKLADESPQENSGVEAVARAQCV